MISRRQVLKGFAAGTATLAISKIADAMSQTPSEPGHDGGHVQHSFVSPEEAIARLKKGNQRYISMNRLSNPGVGPKTRKALTEGGGLMPPFLAARILG